ADRVLQGTRSGGGHAHAARDHAPRRAYLARGEAAACDGDRGAEVYRADVLSEPGRVRRSLVGDGGGKKCARRWSPPGALHVVICQYGVASQAALAALSCPTGRTRSPAARPR